MRALVLSLFLGLSVLGFGCDDKGDDEKFLVQPIGDDYSSISDPRARWEAYRLTDYEFDQQNACFCEYGSDVCRVYVRNNKVVDVIKKSDGKSIFAEVPNRYKTVDELFAMAASLNRDSVASLIIAYDARFGYPAVISVNPSAQIADEEYSYKSENMQRLVK